MAKKLIAGLIVASLAVPATASAASKVYAGTTDGSGQLAMDVVVNRKGKLRGITEVRGKNVPATCDRSGARTVYFTFPTSTKINAHRKFAEVWTQATYGNESSMRGTFARKKVVNGTFHFDQHFEAKGGEPEETCTSPDLAYRLVRGAPDVVPGPVKVPGGGLAAGR
jgi:hypothetical protein